VEVTPWNLFQYSEDFSNAVWNKSRGTITTNNTVAPDGNLTADTFTKTSAVNTVSTVDSTLATYSNTGIYTLSVYIKPIVGNIILLRLDSGGNTANADFNFTTKTFSNDGANIISSSYQELPNGWFRLSITGNVLDTNWTSSICNLYANPTNDSMAIWGAQLVEGSSAKPYFPTTDRLNVPRLTYQNGGGGCPSLLLEKQSTNFVKYSQDFTQSDWTQSGATITANAIISPDGTQNATRVQFSAGSRYVYQTIGGSGIAAGSVTISCWIKGASVQKIGFSDGNANPNEITLTTDWQRYTFTFPYSSGGIGVQFDNYFGVTPSAQTKDFYIWGAQAEQSSYPTSYIPTTSASATRVIDDCRKTGISSLIGQTEGTMFIDLNLTAWDSNSFYFGLYGGGNEIYFRCAGTGAIDFVHYFGATQAFITKSGLSLGRHKLAACYKNNDWAFYVDGILVGTDTSGTFSGTISQMVFGYTSISAYPPFQSVNQTILFPTRLTNAELASLTTI
jgi:hypothetical protein